jgi:hypothetical protein
MSLNAAWGSAGSGEIRACPDAFQWSRAEGPGTACGRGGPSPVYDVAVETAYSPGEWANFAIGLVAAGGALTGLVFVAVSLNAADVLGSAFHLRRAESTFVILLGILTASLLLILPGQGRMAAAAEIVFVGAVLVYRTARTWPVLRTAPGVRP